MYSLFVIMFYMHTRGGGKPTSTISYVGFHSCIFASPTTFTNKKYEEGGKEREKIPEPYWMAVIKQESSGRRVLSIDSDRLILSE